MMSYVDVSAFLYVCMHTCVCISLSTSESNHSHWACLLIHHSHVLSNLLKISLDACVCVYTCSCAYIKIVYSMYLNDLHHVISIINAPVYRNMHIYIYVHLRMYAYTYIYIYTSICRSFTACTSITCVIIIIIIIILCIHTYIRTIIYRLFMACTSALFTRGSAGLRAHLWPWISWGQFFMTALLSAECWLFVPKCVHVWLCMHFWTVPTDLYILMYVRVYVSTYVCVCVCVSAMCICGTSNPMYKYM
jgi:hypothetical protein